MKLGTTAKMVIGAAVLGGAVYFLAKKKKPVTTTSAKQPARAGSKKVAGLNQWFMPADLPSPSLVNPTSWWDRFFASNQVAGLGQELPFIDVGGGDDIDESTKEFPSSETSAPQAMTYGPQAQQAYAYGQQQQYYAMQPAGVIPQGQPIYQTPYYPQQVGVRPTQVAPMYPVNQYPYGTTMQYPAQYPYGTQQTQPNKWAVGDSLVNWGVQVGFLVDAGVSGATCYNKSPLCNHKYRDTKTNKLLTYNQALNAMMKYRNTVPAGTAQQYYTGVSGLGADAAQQQQCVPMDGWWLTLNNPTNGSVEFHSGYRPKGV